MPELVSPFNKIFADWETADWVMNLFEYALIEAGCVGPQDERFALTIPRSDNRRLLRINYGNTWFLNVMGNDGGHGPAIAIPLDRVQW